MKILCRRLRWRHLLSVIIEQLFVSVGIYAILNLHVRNIHWNQGQIRQVALVIWGYALVQDYLFQELDFGSGLLGARDEVRVVVRR